MPFERFLKEFGAGRSWPAILTRYLIALALTAIAFVVRLGLAAPEEGIQFVTFFPAVAITAMLAGLGPALLATVLGAALSAYAFVPPVWSIAVFVTGGVLVSAVAEGMRRYFLGYRRTVHELEQSVRYAEDLLRSSESANRAKSEFLAGMSHELRTPLNAIIGFSELGKVGLFGPPHAKYTEYFEDIHSSGQHVLDLVSELMDLSMIEAGKIVLDEEPFDLGDAMMACVNLMRARAEKGRVTVDYRDPVPIRVFADKRRMKQILLNLLSNGVKYSRENGVVTLSARITTAGGVAVSVADNGIGMDEETLARAIEPFGIAALKRRRKPDSVGLGLAVTKSLVDLHGGRLEIVSRIGEGTVATASFPPKRVLRDLDARTQQAAQ